MGCAACASTGSDAVAVLHVVREARARAAAGQGGTLIEAVIPGLPAADPVAKLQRHLEGRALWDAERGQRLSTEVHADVERAIGEAIAAGPPARETLLRDVFAADGDEGAAT